MTIGPLELVVVGYEGTKVAGDIGKELGALEHAHSVRVVDLALVERAPDGAVEVKKLADMTLEEAAPFVGATGDLMGLLGPAELDRVSEQVAPGTTAVAALVEHTWATGLRDAVRRSDGVLMIDEFLPHETLERLNAELQELEIAGE